MYIFFRQLFRLSDGGMIALDWLMGSDGKYIILFHVDNYFIYWRVYDCLNQLMSSDGKYIILFSSLWNVLSYEDMAFDGHCYYF